MVAERFGTRHPAATVRALSPNEVVPEPPEFSRNSEVHEPGGPSRDILTQDVGASPPSTPAAAPPSSACFALRATLDQEAHDLLLYAKSLLGHAIPSGDLSSILKRALRQLVAAEEKRVYAACARTRPRRGARRRVDRDQHATLLPGPQSVPSRTHVRALVHGAQARRRPHEKGAATPSRTPRSARRGDRPTGCGARRPNARRSDRGIGGDRRVRVPARARADLHAEPEPAA